jgi:predicted  nucleic acid-binding Zn-ribbon protein
MTTPSEHEQSTPSGRTEDLRTRLRPRALDGMSAVGASERFALERVQALEVQVAAAHERERSLTELAVRDGNKIVDLEATVADLTDLAARTDAAERSLFEAEGRAGNATRRAELMEGELMSTRAEVDRMRTRVVELEASLRRALAEVGAATTARGPDDIATERAARMEASAQRSVQLADRLRLKVVDLESSLRAVVTDMNAATAALLRAAEAEAALADAGEAQIDEERSAEAEGRLAELEGRLAALDTRIAALSTSMHPEQGDTVVDLREAEADVDVDADVDADVEPEDTAEPELPDAPASDEVPIAPPASRWSDWHST